MKDLPILQMTITVIIFAVSAFVHIVFAAGIYDDARKLRAQGGSTFAVGGWVWAFATLLGGILVALAYWVIHGSAVRSEQTLQTNGD
jgi:NADH:ubiquinone oxidoreductase subunit 6 (subunit J)